MDCIYYRDTKKALEKVDSEALSFLNDDLKEAVEGLVSEVAGLLEHYEDVAKRADEAEEKVSELELEIERLSDRW